MKKGDFIRISYIGRLENGEIFDLTDEEIAKKENVFNEKITYRPVPVIVGAGFLVPGLDKAVQDMEVGEEKKINVAPEDAFGSRDPNLVKVVPAKMFEGKVEPRAGMIVDFSGMKGRIQSVDGGRVRVDFNNPLAGKALSYELTVTEKIEGDKEKIAAIFEFFGIEKMPIKVEGSEASITAKIPDPLKEKISSLVVDYVPGVEKVHFIDTYVKKEKS